MERAIILDNGKMERDMAKVKLYNRMEIFMKGYGIMISYNSMEEQHIIMGICMKDNGKIIIKMGKEY